MMPIVAATNYTGMLGAIAILVMMILGMYWMAGLARKRLGMGSGTLPVSALKVVGKRQLEARKALYVVELGDRYVLVGTGEHQVNFIDHISSDEYAAMLQTDESEATDSNTARLRLARRHTVDTSVELAATGTDTNAPTAEQRFATVGESFGHLLNKARGRSGSSSNT
jgi:flagellar biogenesis protein FliO